MSTSTKTGEVLVVDENNLYLAPTNAANARRLLKCGMATVALKKPFTIALFKQVTDPDTQRRSKAMRISNYHEFFNEPKAIYIQNISNPIGAISLEFRRTAGVGQIPFRVLPKRDPICLTNFVSFDTIKGDVETFIRTLSSSGNSSAKLQLITKEEYDAYYERKQAEYGTESAEELKEIAQENAFSYNGAIDAKLVAIVDEQADKASVDASSIYTPPSINKPTIVPKVLSICAKLQAGTSSEPNYEKISARDALDMLNALSLTNVDYEYVLSNVRQGDSKDGDMVRKWVVNRMGNRDMNDIISQPKKKKTKAD